MLAICAALRWEIRPILRALGQARRIPGMSVPVWQPKNSARRTLVFQTGIGCERTAAVISSMLDSFRVTAIINTGCAGGLVSDLPPGSLVVPETIIGVPEMVAYRTDATWADRLRLAAARLGRPVCSQPIVTCAAPVRSVAAKQSAHRRFGAVAVEMEGSTVAQATAARGLPFASVRTILDAGDVDLPQLSLERQDIGHPARIALQALRRSRQIEVLSTPAQAAEEALFELFRIFLKGQTCDD